MNLELLSLAEYLGRRYDARVTSWGRDEDGNKSIGGHPESWHLWSRGANAVDLAPSVENPKNAKRRLDMMADEARSRGFRAIANHAKGYVHIEVSW